MNLSFLLRYLSDRLSTQVLLYNSQTKNLVQQECRSNELKQTLTLTPQAIQQLASYQNESVPNIVVANTAFVFGIVSVNESTLIVGPIKSQSNYQFNKNIAITDFGTVKLEHVPKLNLNRFVDSLHLAHNLFHTFELITEDILLQNFSEDMSVMKQKYLSLLFKTRERDDIHNPYTQEVREMNSVTAGDVVALKQSWIEAYNGKLGILAPTPLRSAKNLGIVLITIVSRAAMRGGLNSEIAYSLSDTFINEIEHQETIEAIYHLAKHAEIEYTLLVKESQTATTIHTQENRYMHPYVIQGQQYIYANLHRNLMVTDVATVVNVHPNYFSRIFKQDTGLTVQELVTQQKIRYAEQLLVASTKTISEISTNIGYNSQSYFTKVFRNVTGYTPHAYRRQFSNL